MMKYLADNASLGTAAMNTGLIDIIVARWTDPAARPLFKGKLIDGDGCRCAQGDILHLSGWSDDQLRTADQTKVDGEVAALLGVTRFEAILLRQVNDSCPGSPQAVFNDLPAVIGPEAKRIVAFMRHVEAMADAARDAAGHAARGDAWVAARAAAWVAARTAGKTAGDIARAAAQAAAGDIARIAARAAAGVAAQETAGHSVWIAAWDVAGAVSEVQGASIMRQRNQLFYFLPLFGFSCPEEIPL